MSDKRAATMMVSRRASSAVAPRGIELISLTRPNLDPFVVEATATIGRDPSADICLDAPGVSRMHALVRVTDNRAELVDTRSNNGSFVNGTKVERALLHPGDVIRVGNEELRVAARQVPLEQVMKPRAPRSGAASGGTAPAAPAPPALAALAEERRQLAILYSVALRVLESRADPIEVVFGVLDRVSSFDAAFVALADPPSFRAHPAGLRLRAEDCRRVLDGLAAADGPQAFDAQSDALGLSTYTAASRAVIPLSGGRWLALLSGLPGAYSAQLEFLGQLGRILAAALSRSAPERGR